MTLLAKGLCTTVDAVVHLDSVDLVLRPGRIHTVLGRTLAGKTTLLRALAGLAAVDSGVLELDGADISRVPPWKRDTAMVYQQFINYPHLSVLDNVVFPLRRAGVPRGQARDRAAQALATVGLDGLGHRRPSQLSGGQQQRVAIARALVRDCRLVLLDEPLANLDYKLREQLREEFRDLFSGAGESVVVYTTTDPAEALMLGDEVIVMHQGRVVQVGPASEVFERPGTTDVASIVNDPPMNLFDGEVSEEMVTFGGMAPIHRPAHLAGLPAGRYRLGLRADDVHRAGDGPAGEGRASAVVTFVEISGSESNVSLRVGVEDMMLRIQGIHDLALGSTLAVDLDVGELFVFDLDGTLRVAPMPTGRGGLDGAS